MHHKQSAKFSSSTEFFAWSLLIVLLIGLGIHAEHLSLSYRIPYSSFTPFYSFLDLKEGASTMMLAHSILGMLVLLLWLILRSFSSQALTTSKELSYLLGTQWLFLLCQGFNHFIEFSPLHQAWMGISNMSLYFMFVFTTIVLAVASRKLLNLSTLGAKNATSQKNIKKLGSLCAVGVSAMLFQRILSYYLSRIDLSTNFLPMPWNHGLTFTYRTLNILLLGLLIRIAILGQSATPLLKKISLLPLIFAIGQFALGFLMIDNKLPSYANVTHFSVELLLWSSLSFCYAKAFWTNILIQKQESHNIEAS